MSGQQINSFRRTSFQSTVCILLMVALSASMLGWALPMGVSTAMLYSSTILITICLLFKCRLAVRLNLHFFCFCFLIVTASSSAFISEQYLVIMPNLLGYALLFLVFGNINIDKKLLSRLLTFLLFCSVLNSTTALLMVFSGSEFWIWTGRKIVDYSAGVPVLYLSLGGSNATGLMSVIGSIVSLGCLLRSNRKTNKLGFILFLILTSLAFLLCFSRAAGLALAVGVIFIFIVDLKCSHRVFKAPTLILKTMLKVFFLFWIVYVVIYLFLSGESVTSDLAKPADNIISNKEGSITARLALLEALFDIFTRYPMFGIGYGNSKVYTEQLIGWPLSPHSTIFAAFVEFGLFAGLAILYLMLAPFLVVYRKLRLLEPGERLPIVVFFAVFLAFFVFSIFHSTMISYIFWFFLALCINLDRYQT